MVRFFFRFLTALPGLRTPFVALNILLIVVVAVFDVLQRLA